MPAFVLKGYKGSTRVFQGAVIITHGNEEWKYVEAAWNYAVRKTSTGFDTVDYEAALNWLREHYPDWHISEQCKVHEVSFHRRTDILADYKPPSK